MKQCKCENYKKLIIDINAVENTQDWNFCTFCGEQMVKMRRFMKKNDVYEKTQELYDQAYDWWERMNQETRMVYIVDMYRQVHGGRYNEN